MNIFCTILGHTWLAETRAPDVRWATTKLGHIFEPVPVEEPVRHFDVCRRCGTRRPSDKRRHDDDRPASGAE